MIDHVSLRVSDVARSKRFFSGALAPLGYAVLADYGDAAGFGLAPKPDFWVGAGPAAGGPTHVCFAAANRAQVDAFHKAALAAGGTDNGAPGLRAMYHPTYYGAFILDPDGNNIEAVCHQPV
jgi:catechol 2,3-dioxygenase-like lactoylglutathione lyase family enzyme